MKDVDDPTDEQEKIFDSGLEFAKAGRRACRKWHFA
jgi:hypothetical protein